MTQKDVFMIHHPLYSHGKHANFTHFFIQICLASWTLKERCFLCFLRQVKTKISIQNISDFLLRLMIRPQVKMFFFRCICEIPLISHRQHFSLVKPNYCILRGAVHIHVATDNVNLTLYFLPSQLAHLTSCVAEWILWFCCFSLFSTVFIFAMA